MDFGKRVRNLKTFISSDQHFLHEKLLDYVPTRPSNYNSLIFHNHNSVVTNEDTFICLGDISAGLGKIPDGKEKLKKIISNLNGKIKILIRGNHDHFQDKFYLDCGFNYVMNYFVKDGAFFCHYPLEPENQYTKPEEEKLKEIFKLSGCQTIYHGHTHCRDVNLDDGIKRINCCVDANNYFPFELV